MRRKKKKTSEEKVFKLASLFFGLGLLVLMAGGVAAYLAFKNDSGNIQLAIDAPAGDIYRGVPVKIDFKVDNNTESILSNPRLVIKIPAEKLVSLDDPGGSLISVSLDPVGPRNLAKKTIRFLPIAPLDSPIKIKAVLSYNLGRTVFEVKAEKEITVSKNSVEFSFRRPEQIIGGSIFQLDVDYKNVSPFDFKNLNLKLDYPGEFKYVSANLEPDVLTNIWRLGGLNAGSEGSLKIQARLEGSVGVDYPLKAKITTELGGKAYVIAAGESKLTINSSPITLRVDLNGVKNYVSRLGDRLNYTITYLNQTGIALNNTVVSAELISPLFDLSSLDTNGRIDFGSKTVIWDQKTNPELALVEPNRSGQVKLSVNLKKVFPIGRLGDKNYTLKLRVKLSSPSVPYYLEADRTTALTELENKVAGLLKVDAKALFRDANSGIINNGGLPPSVGEPTQFTVHWAVSNFANDVSDVLIRATLPPNVKFTGVVKSNIDSQPAFDEQSRTVSWQIDNIKANSGVLTPPIEAVFQIEATPTIDMIGKYEPLLGQTTITARDDFANIGLVGYDNPLDTSLNDDQTVEETSGIVQ